MEMIKLRTGYEMAKSVAVATRISIESLMAQGIVGMTALYDLREIAKNPAYVKEVFPENLKTLQDFALVDRNGTMHNEIRQVVLASFEGEQFDFELVSPV